MRLPLLAAALAVSLAGCGSSGSSPPPSPVPTTASPASDAVVRLDRQAVKRRGYTPAPRYLAVRTTGGATLYAFYGVCTGSADGHCQQMFFFLGERFLGTGARAPVPGIERYTTTGQGGISVAFAGYQPSDPLCCPSGKPVTVIYHWTGGRLVHSGHPPGG